MICHWWALAISWQMDRPRPAPSSRRVGPRQKRSNSLPKYGSPPPMRRVVLAWRRSFTRYEAIAALRNAVYACELPGVTRLS